MKKTLFSVIFILCLFAVNQLANAQDKPAPVQSATFDMLMGTWDAEPYQMMGSTWNETATHSMKHNGQYMFIDLSGKDNNGQTYSGTIIVAPMKDGTFSGYGFDDWGGVTTATGKADGNKIHVESKSMWGTEVRDIEINGNTMTHKVAWTMKDKEGKEMKQNMTITYHKK